MLVAVIFVWCSSHPAAMLNKHRKKNNNNIPLSIIKIEDMRIVGNVISLLRLLRLRDPLVATINSNESLKLNL